MFQLDGVQQVVLFPPDSDCCMVQSGARGHMLDRSQSLLDPWTDHIPCEVFSVVLRKGELLLAPSGWWLSARTIDASLSILGSSRPAMSPELPLKGADAYVVQALPRLHSRKAEETGLLKEVGCSGQGSLSPSGRYNAICHCDVYQVREAGSFELVKSSRQNGPIAFFVGADASLAVLGDALRVMVVGERALLGPIVSPASGTLEDF